MWRGWHSATHTVAEFEIAPAALAQAATRSFTRVRDAECSPDGYVCENAYGAPLRVRISRDESALITSDINLALLREVGKIERACKLRGRGESVVAQMRGV